MDYRYCSLTKIKINIRKFQEGSNGRIFRELLGFSLLSKTFLPASRGQVMRKNLMSKDCRKVFLVFIVFARSRQRTFIRDTLLSYVILGQPRRIHVERIGFYPVGLVWMSTIRIVARFYGRKHSAIVQQGFQQWSSSKDRAMLRPQRKSLLQFSSGQHRLFLGRLGFASVAASRDPVVQFVCRFIPTAFCAGYLKKDRVTEKGFSWVLKLNRLLIWTVFFITRFQTRRFALQSDKLR